MQSNSSRRGRHTKRDFAQRPGNFNHQQRDERYFDQPPGNFNHQQRDERYFDQPPGNFNHQQRDERYFDQPPGNFNHQQRDERYFDRPPGNFNHQQRDERYFDRPPGNFNHQQRDERYFDRPPGNFNHQQRDERYFDRPPGNFNHQQRDERYFDRPPDNFNHQQRDERYFDRPPGNFNHQQRDERYFDQPPGNFNHQQRDERYFDRPPGNFNHQQRDERYFDQPPGNFHHQQRDERYFDQPPGNVAKQHGDKKHSDRPPGNVAKQHGDKKHSDRPPGNVAKQHGDKKHSDRPPGNVAKQHGDKKHSDRPPGNVAKQQGDKKHSDRSPGNVADEKTDLEINIERMLQRMKNRYKEVLQEHSLKLESLRDRLFNNDLNDSQNVLVDKEQELRCQQSEFIIYCDQLESRVNSIESNIKFRDIAPIINKEFAIECLRLKLGYPIYAHRLEIVESVRDNQVTIVLGETGSGKSTQLVQYFHAAGFSQDGLIACTQPRKIAALSVSKFVASELGTALGGKDVGYRAGHKKMMNKDTRIIFMSDYEMFCEFQKDEHLSAYSCLIIDEVHERSIYTDLLLAMVKSCLSRRHELKLVVMSATIDPSIFLTYFPNSHLIRVPGRSYPVDVIWKNPSNTEESDGSYENAAVRKAIEVHVNEEEGDILVFLSTPKETDFCSSKFSSSMSARNDYICLSLHGRLDADDQQKVFEPPPEGKRKIVFATNCAETSITIPNIKFVIDTGFAKEVFYEKVSKMDTLSVRLISQSSADQRKGRAGRTSKGKCFRLYTEDEYIIMRKSTEPEILRIHPAKAALKLFQMGADPSDFDFLEAPPVDVLSDTVDFLDNLGAISDKKITPLGNQIAELPFEPEMSIFVINAMQQDMTAEAVSVACLSSFSGNIFYRGRNDEEIENNRHKQLRFHDEYGDMISLLHVLQEYLNQSKTEKKRWCLGNAINEKTLRSVCEKMREVFDILRCKLKCQVTFPSKLTFNRCAIAKLFFTCFKRNTCIYLGHPQAGYLALKEDKRVHIHPSSSIQNLNLNPPFLIYQNLMSTSRDFAFTVLSVNESWLKDLCQSFQERITEAESQIVKVVVERGLGQQFARYLIGPKYSGLKQLQNEIRQKVSDESVFVDVSKGKSELLVYSKESISVEVKDLTEERLLLHVNRQQEEFKEIKIDDNPSAPKAILKSGGCIMNMIMPRESRSVIIKDVPEEIGTKEVREKLEKFGKIADVKTFNSSSNNNRWGCVIFETLDSAKECLISTSSDTEIVAVPSKSNEHKFSQCSAELTWTRRPLKGIGFIEFTDVEDFLDVSRDSYNTQWRFKIARNRPEQLFIPSVPKETNEEEIKRYFTSNYHLRGDIKVILPRIVKSKSVDEEREAKNNLDIQLRKFFDYFTINMRDIKPKDFYYKAWIEFPNNQVIPTNNIHLRLEDQFVKFTPKFRSQIVIKSKLYEILKDEMSKEIQVIKNEASGSLEFEAKELKNGNFCLILNSDSAKKLNWAKKYLNHVITGDVLEIGVNQVIHVVFSKEGRTFFEELEKNIPGSLSFLDYRYMTLTIHGTEAVRTLVKLELNNFLDRMLTMTLKIINLQESGRPKGLKRELIVRYGEDLEKLKTELNLAQIQLRRNTIEARGSEESLQKLERLLYELPGYETEEDEIDCVACFCPVKFESVYRIESCGHPYCKECLKQLVHLALKERKLPLVCSQDDCNMNMCWKDFDNFCKMSITTQRRLVDSSFSHFMSTKPDKYKYCITPDCCTVYQITTTGEPYICYKCEATTCTTCHVDYHVGITCKMYESSKDADQDIQKWLREDVKNRRRCPNCKGMIEKDGGCQHVSCSCGMHICWTCMDIFQSSQICYAHMYRQHGSFM